MRTSGAGHTLSTDMRTAGAGHNLRKNLGNVSAYPTEVIPVQSSRGLLQIQEGILHTILRMNTNDVGAVNSAAGGIKKVDFHMTLSEVQVASRIGTHSCLVRNVYCPA